MKKPTGMLKPDGKHVHSNNAQFPVSVSPLVIRGITLLLAALLTLIVLKLAPGSSHTAEEQSGSLNWTLSPDTRTEKRLTIIAIDEQSLAEVGPWPWPRETLARLSENLADYGVTQQLFDIVLPESREGDQILLEQLRSVPSVLAQIPVLGNGQSIQTGRMTHHVSGLSCQPPLPRTQSFLASHDTFSPVNKGHITPIVDQDGMIRHVPPVICVQGQAYPSLAVSALLNALELENDPRYLSISEGHGLLAPDWTLQVIDYPGISIPLDQHGNMRIAYHQHPDSFQVVSAVSVLNGKAPANLLQDRWALIGATAFGMGDIVPTPHSGATPGVEIQARLIASLLDGQIPYQPARADVYQLTLSLLFAGLLLLIASRGNRTASAGLPVAAVVMPLAALALHLQLLSQHQIWLGWLAPALFSLLAAVFLMLIEHTRVRMEKLRVFNNLSSYLPGDVANEIAFSLPEGAIKAKRKELVLMCADLRNFSAYGEARPPEEAAALLHCFFVSATEVIEQAQGQIEEFKGDAILASWPVTEQHCATQQALQAAWTLQETMSRILPEKAPAGLEPLALGIGIEKGPVLSGSIGPSHRRAHTLLGDTVTITLRIQEMTQELAQPILIGEGAARDLPGDQLESQGAYLLDGLQTPHNLFAPEDTVPESEDTDAHSSGSDGHPPLRMLSGGKR